jgi:hypothetical protein
MISRTAKSQMQHDEMVKAVVNHLVQNGHKNIKADLPGHAQPALIQGTKQNHIPDAAADGVVVEVETSDTISGDHTTSQWQLFSDHAAKNGKAFWVVVPSDSVQATRNRLDELGLTAVVYGI